MRFKGWVGKSVLLATGWIAGAALFAPSSSHASEEFFVGALCEVEDNTANTSVVGGALNNDTSASGVWAVCPFVTGSAIKHTNVSYLTVSVNDTSSVYALSAAACVRYWGGSTATCPTASATSGTGYSSLSPSLSVWNNASYSGWGPYLRIGFPQDGTNSQIIMVYASAP